MVGEAGSRPSRQHISWETIRGVLEGRAPVLADALGARRWGMCIQVPTGVYIERTVVMNYLHDTLPGSVLFDGSPRVSIIHGPSGTGKTSSASLFARSRLEHVAFVLWLDASSPSVLESQVPAVLEQMGTRVPLENPTAEGLMTLLGELPVPWLLVLDGAQSLDDIDAWVPRSGYGQTLILTARADWPQDFAPALRLDGFNRTEARTFFAERLDRPEGAWSTQQLSACDEIADRLSRWPLALELAVSWIQRRGASLEVMQQFAERLERLDLNDPHLLPHGYPRTAAQVIIDLLAELSESAQLVLSVLLLLGGDRIPEQLIIEWARRTGLSVEDPLEELFAASVTQRGITTNGRPHDYDETIAVHDFLKLVVRSRGMEMDGATVLHLVEASEQALGTLTEAGRFREGATLVDPLDHFLRQLVDAVHENTMMMIRLSVLMHNLAQLAVLTSKLSVARTWFIAAVNVRRTDPNRFEHNAVGLQMQLQTLAGAATVMARQNDVEGLKRVAAYVCDLVEGTDKSTYDNSESLAALESIRVNYLRLFPEAIDQISALAHLVRGNAAGSVSVGNAKVIELQNEMERAIRIVATDDWRYGLDTALAAANHALEEELLVDWMVDGLLDVGLELITAIVRRQHELPGWLLDCLQRMAAWFNENPVHLNESQQQRLRLVQGIATGESSSVRAAAASLPGPEKLIPMLSAWGQVASIVADQLDRFQRYEVFGNLSGAVTINLSVGGGDDINFWQQIESSSGVPILWVCTASRVRYDSRGKTDPLREAFLNAGLPHHCHEEQLQLASGWSATLRRDALTIQDGDGNPWVMADGLAALFCERIGEMGGLVLVYGDRALATQDNDPAPRGWVPLSNDRRPRSEGAFRRRVFGNLMRRKGDSGESS